MNYRKMGKSAGSLPKEITAKGAKPAGGVTRTSGAEPKDYKTVPDAPGPKDGYVMKWHI